MQQAQTVRCGRCDFEFRIGVHACQGCTGHVVYGATQYEVSEARKFGAMLWGAGGFALVYFLPMFLNAQFGFTIGNGWGLGPWGIVIPAVLAAWGIFLHDARVKANKRDLIRTFPP